MRVSVAFGSTARAACLACLRAQDGVGLVGELRLEPGQQFGVRRAAGVGGGGEDLQQFGVVLHAGRHHDLRVVLGHIPLRKLRIREVPVADQLVGARPREAR